MSEERDAGIIDLDKARSERKISISCCMITRDEESFIGDAIRSVASLAGEVIVLDTGSIDGTAEVAAGLGAKVYKSNWDNDFSAARNKAIDKASGDWILILDADETIDEDSHERIREIIAGDPAAAFMFEQWTYTDDTDTFGWRPLDGSRCRGREMLGYFSSQQVRLFRNRGDIRYRGHVHEDVEEALSTLNIPIYRVEGVVIHHYGRQKDSERVKRKYQMYLDLGEKKLAANPGNSKYIFELASQLLGLGYVEESLEQIERGLAVRPDSWEFLNLKGLALLKQGHTGVAVECLEAAVDINREKPDLYNNLGVVLLEGQRPDAALAALQEGLKLSPGNPNLLRNAASASLKLDDTESALDLIERSLAIDPFMSQSHLIHADVLFRKGSFDEAADALEKIRFIQGTDLKVYLKSVFIYSEMKMTDKASDVVGRALTEYPDHEGLVFLSAKVHELKGEFDSAIAIYRELLSGSPSNSEIHNSLGCIYEKKGELLLAEDHFSRAFELSPGNLQVETNLAIVQGKLGRDEDAERHMKAVLKNDIRNGSAYNAYGCFLSKRARYMEALDIFSRAIEIDPGDVRLYLNLGLLCEKMDLPVKAVEIYRKVTEIDPAAVGIIETRLNHLKETVS